MRETWVQSLGWEDPLEKGKATHSSILTWRIQGHKESDTTEQLSHVFPLVVGLCYGYSHPLHNANIEPAMQETPFRFLGREDPLEKG